MGKRVIAICDRCGKEGNAQKMHLYRVGHKDNDYTKELCKECHDEFLKFLKPKEE